MQFPKYGVFNFTIYIQKKKSWTTTAVVNQPIQVHLKNPDLDSPIAPNWPMDTQ